MEQMAITIHICEKQIIYRELGLIAYNIQTDKVVTVGEECLKYLESDEIAVLSPFADGKIAEFELAVVMFRELLKRAYVKAGVKSRFKRRRFTICTEQTMTSIDKKVIMDCFYQMSKNVEISDTTYQEHSRMLLGNQATDRKSKEIIIAFEVEDHAAFIKDSLQRIIEKAAGWGMSREEVLRLCKDMD